MNDRCSFPAQVCAVFDTDGTMHPQWVRFKNADDEIITLQNFIILRENSNFDKIWKNFLCTSKTIRDGKEFFLCYNYTRHVWEIEYNVSLDRKKYLLTGQYP